MLVMCMHNRITRTRKIKQCIGKLQYVISMHVRQCKAYYWHEVFDKDCTCDSLVDDGECLEDQ